MTAISYRSRLGDRGRRPIRNKRGWVIGQTVIEMLTPQQIRITDRVLVRGRIERRREFIELENPRTMIHVFRVPKANAKAAK